MLQSQTADKFEESEFAYSFFYKPFHLNFLPSFQSFSEIRSLLSKN